MKIDEKSRDVKLQHDINREQKKYHHYHQCKINKYEYVAGEDILPSDQS